jgi:hypothetical protein
MKKFAKTEPITSRARIGNGRGSTSQHAKSTFDRSSQNRALDRPGQALTVPEVEASKISRQSVHEGGKVVRPTHRPPLSEGDIPVTSVRG